MDPTLEHNLIGTWWGIILLGVIGSAIFAGIAKPFRAILVNFLAIPEKWIKASWRDLVHFLSVTEFLKTHPEATAAYGAHQLAQLLLASVVTIFSVPAAVAMLWTGYYHGSTGLTALTVALVLVAILSICRAGKIALALLAVYAIFVAGPLKADEDAKKTAATIAASLKSST